MIFTDIIGQQIHQGQKFGEMNYNESTRQYHYRTGVISKVNKDSYVVKYNEGLGSKRGSKRHWKPKFIVNFDIIPFSYEENFFVDAYKQNFIEGNKFVEVNWNENKKKHYAVYGTIGKVTESSYELVFADKKYTKYNQRNKIIQNYDYIVKEFPEGFL